ncbi:coiled-coil domain-containing protein 154 [Thomomys bottae]
MSELAGSTLSGASPPSQLSTVTLEDLELLLAEALTSSEPLNPEETSERYECCHCASNLAAPKQSASKCKGQLEQSVADLQAEVACLRGHKERCEQVTLGLLRELLQLRARVQLQDSELQELQQEVQQAARTPEKDALEFSGSQKENQMQVLDIRLVEVREALMQIRQTQALQNSERKSVERDMSLRLTQLTGLLRQEEKGREVACGALQKSQQDTSQKVERVVAKLQVLVTKLGEEMSLRFLKREAKLCGFLQKSFLALEQRMKALENTRLKVENSLREELEVRWQKLLDLTEEHMRMVQAQRQEEEGHLLGQCQGLDAAVVQLTTFVRQNQLSLNRVLLAEQKAREAIVNLEESQAGELASYLHENLEAVQLSGKLAQQEMQSALELLQEKSRALEELVADVARQLKDLSDHCLALSWRLDLQEQTLGMKLSQVRSHGVAFHHPSGVGCQLARQLQLPAFFFVLGVDSLQASSQAVSWAPPSERVFVTPLLVAWVRLAPPAGPAACLTCVIRTETLGFYSAFQAKIEWECAERKSQEDLVRRLKEVSAQLQAVQEQVDSFPQKIEGISGECTSHRSDADLKISAEGKARAAAVDAVQLELAALQSSVQLLKENHPGRKIAEIQGNLATFQKQMIKLEHSIQVNKTIQNLKFNTETKLRTEEIAGLRESVLRLWSEEGPWPLTLGSKRMLMALVRQRFFIKDVAPDGLVSVNRWGLYQALRWAAGVRVPPPQAGAAGREAGEAPRAMSLCVQVAAVESCLHEPGSPA